MTGYDWLKPPTYKPVVPESRQVAERRDRLIKLGVRDAILALSAECDFKSGAIATVTGSGYWKTFSDWLEQKASQIEQEGGV